MVAPLVIAGVGAALGTAASVIGALIAEGRYEEAQRERERVAADYGDEALPELDKQVAATVGDTELASIREDPQLRASQIAAMRKLEETYQSGGMTAEDAAALELANAGAAQRAQSDYQSLAHGLAARGQTMNPALAAAMAAQSSGSVVDATAQNRYRAQADARDRAMRALEGSASIAGNVRAADYGVASARASAQDRINQFNAERQAQAAWQNTQLAQQNFGNRMDLKKAENDARLGVAADEETRGQRYASIGAGIGSGITQGAFGAANYEAERQRRERDRS